MRQISISVLSIVCVLMTTATQIALKFGVSSPALSNVLSSGNTFLFLVRAATAPMVMAGLLLYGGSILLWLMVLARSELSYAYPIISLGFAISAIYARFGLHDTLGTARIAGIALILVGVILVSRS